MIAAVALAMRDKTKIRPGRSAVESFEGALQMIYLQGRNGFLLSFAYHSNSLTSSQDLTHEEKVRQQCTEMA